MSSFRSLPRFVLSCGVLLVLAAPAAWAQAATARPAAERATTEK